MVPTSAIASTIVVLGDSLSAGYGVPPGQGWVALLEQRLRERGSPHTVINASISGDTTASGRARLPSLLARHHPGLVLVQLGGNDGLRGLSPGAMQRNLAAMLAAVREAGAHAVLVGVRLPPNYGQTYIQRFQQVYERVAADQGAALVPFLLNGVAEHGELMQADGVHPNVQAQPRLLENVWQVLEPLLELNAR
jgi:acyl-CoA thioesterase-1